MTRRFWVELALASVSGVLLVLTVMWHDWIEIVFRVDPDHGNGSVEYLVVGLTAVSAATSSLLAAIEWRRVRATTA